MSDAVDPRVQAMVDKMTGAEKDGVLLDRSPAWWANFLAVALRAADAADPLRSNEAAQADMEASRAKAWEHASEAFMQRTAAMSRTDRLRAALYGKGPQ